MYRTAARPAPLDFPLPAAHRTPQTDGRRDVGSYSQPKPRFYLEAPIRNGLRTPPTDDMTTAYQNSTYSNAYSASRNSEYLSVEVPASNYGEPYHNRPSSQSRPYMSLPQPAPTSASTVRRDVQEYQPQPPSPEPSQRTSYPSHEEPTRRKGTTDTIRPNLQIPKTISCEGGSLAEFAAQMTCLFWFESSDTLRLAEQPMSPDTPVKRLEREALPTNAFRKWVVTILSTTQVTENVIILALLFIYRLKTSNPAVKGNNGSEYRLLTVALMLGNKFLDDNTYTNKTWAEVSGISVGEIHVMEVEFLSNMRYSLLASKAQWAEWQSKLRNIRNYCHRAAEPPVLVSPPGMSSLHPNFPSPPSTQGSPTHAYPSAALGQQWSGNALPPISSPISNLPDLDYRAYSRKRSSESDLEEPVAKRITRPTVVTGQYAPTPYNNTSQYVPPSRPEARRLPVPDLTISTSQSMSSGYSAPTTLAPVLPPLGAGRSMAGVYPTTPTNWAPSVPMLTPTGQHPSNGHLTPSRRHSPRSVQDLLSHASSPVSATFPDQYAKHFSPSFFLQERSSPYRPVRFVNTLFHPPPSSSMHNYSINADQMTYQPLGKRNDNRVGVVPDYHPTPYQQRWPAIRQPNFHA